MATPGRRRGPVPPARASSFPTLPDSLDARAGPPSRPPPRAADAAADRPAHGRQQWAFSSSGWLFVYTFGVVKCLKELGMDKDVYAIATSGGACAASFLFFDCSGGEIEKTIDYVCDCAVYARSHWRNPFKILQYLEGAIDRFVGARGADLNGSLEVSVTTLPWLRNARITRFDGAPGAMRDAILASSCATPYTPVWLPALRSWCIDGAVSDLKLVRGVLLGRRFFSLHQDDAVSVCPFYFSRADLAPSRFVPPWWSALPPPPAKLRAVCDLGYRDAARWLHAAGRLPTELTPEQVGSPPRWWTVARTPPGAGRRKAAARRAAGRRTLVATLAIAAAWAAIALELAVAAGACLAAALLAPLLRDVPTADAWARFARLATPGRPWGDRLREHSAVYRILRFALL